MRSPRDLASLDVESFSWALSPADKRHLGDGTLRLLAGRCDPALSLIHQQAADVGFATNPLAHFFL